MSAPLRLGPRNARVGWDDRTRGFHIREVVSNDRFLVLRGVRVPHLASHLLGRVAGRLASDWEGRHGVRPALAETCVSPGLRGTSYRAAGWSCAGWTSGRPPGSGPALRLRKRVWLRGLEPGWRERLRRPPARAPGSFPALPRGGAGSTMVRPLSAQPDFETPVKTGREVRIESHGGKRARPSRTAVTELSIGRVSLRPPKGREAEEPVQAWLVRVLETDPPENREPLEWLLLSSEGGPTAEWAERIVGWYEARWGIEEYFRVLKSGARIEDRRLREADALVKCLAFDAVTAWQVFSLGRYARDAPETPAAEVLTAVEREVVGTVVRAEGLLPPAERGRPFGRDIRSWVVLLARMAGWRPSKRRPLPGNTVLWRACVQLQLMVRVTQAARAP